MNTGGVARMGRTESGRCELPRICQAANSNVWEVESAASQPGRKHAAFLLPAGPGACPLPLPADVMLAGHQACWHNVTYSVFAL